MCAHGLPAVGVEGLHCAPHPPCARRAFLQFEGVDSAFYCWLDGQLVGFSKDSRTTAEFDVTHILTQQRQRPSGHTLAVQVGLRVSSSRRGRQLFRGPGRRLRLYLHGALVALGAHLG